MKYRMEVRSVFNGTPTDLLADVVGALSQDGIDDVTGTGYRLPVTGLVVVNVTFEAADDAAARAARDTLPNRLNYPTEADSLRTGRGRSHRRVRS